MSYNIAKQLKTAIMLTRILLDVFIAPIAKTLTTIIYRYSSNNVSTSFVVLK